jgi:hypothetical protein
MLVFSVNEAGDVVAELEVPPDTPYDHVRAMGRLFAGLAPHPEIARMLGAAVDDAVLSGGVARELLSAIESASGPAISPLDVL